MYLSRDNSGGSATAAQAPGDGGHLLGAVAIAITVSRELWRQMHDIIAPELVISGVCDVVIHLPKCAETQFMSSLLVIGPETGV